MKKILFGIVIGGVCALLAARRPGKELMADLQKSDDPLDTLFKEISNLDTDFIAIGKSKVNDWWNED